MTNPLIPMEKFESIGKTSVNIYCFGMFKLERTISFHLIIGMKIVPFSEQYVHDKHGAWA